MKKITENIIAKLKVVLPHLNVKIDSNISAYTTMHMQVKVRVFVEVGTRSELIDSVRFAQEENIPYRVLGGGSNIVILHSYLDEMVIRNMYQEFEILNETDTTADIVVSSGYPMARFVAETIQKGFAGFEYHLGLPGTVGGALYMNSKWTKPLVFVGDLLTQATLLDKNSKEKTVTAHYFHFAYDFSQLQKTKEIVIDAQFHVQKEDSAILKKRAQEALLYRKATQPTGVATSGCFFQNITQEEAERAKVPTTSAGYLIDHAGLKGYKAGGFVVSDKHANFVIHEGKGTPEDLHTLLNHMKKTIKEKFGITLREEVETIKNI